MKEIIIATLMTVATLLNNVAETYADMDAQISATAKKSCYQYGEEYDICPELLMAIIETESCGDPNAENKGCIGLMQISERWHVDRMERLEVTNLYDEDSNILVGADYLAELFDRYEDVSYVLDVYNGNSDAKYNVQNGIMSDYATKILERSSDLERLHGK